MIFKKREKTILLVMAFLFLLTTTVSAEYITVKDDWFKYKETFSVGTDVYDLLIVHPNFESLRVKHNDFATFVNLGSCHEGDVFKYCYKNYSFDQKADIDSEGNLLPGIHVEISKLKDVDDSSLNIDISSSDTGKKFIVEENSFVIELENKGDLSLYNAEFILRFPDNVSIKSPGDFNQITRNQLRLLFSLQKGEFAEFSFLFDVLSVEEKKIDYELLSSDGEVIKSGSFTVRGIVPYSVSVSLPTKSDIREIHTLDVKIKNNHPSEDLVVNDLLIKGPVNFQYLTFYKLNSFVVGQFYYSPVIGPGEESVHSVRFRPFFAGNYDFDVLVELELFDFFLFEESKKLEVINEGFGAGLLFSRKSISLGANNNLVLTLQNDHSSLDFRDIDVKIESELFNVSKKVDSIGPGNSIKVIDQRLNPPQLNETKEYSAEAIVIFTNEVGQRETLSFSDSFKVLGNDTLLKINKKVSPTKVKAGDELIVEVSVRNLVDNMLDVFVEDSFSQNVDLIVGRQVESTTLGGGEEKKVYLYKLRIPEKPYSDELVITTIAKVPDLDYALESSFKVVVEGEIFEEYYVDVDEEDSDVPEVDDDVDDGVVSDDSDNESSQEASDDSGFVEDESNGFFAKLIKGVQNFFTGLFGGK